MMFSLLLPAAAHAANAEKTRPYLYEDTKYLVELVEDAATLMERKGQGAFREFGVKGSRWLNRKYYLFIYDVYGKCVFHPVNPELVGRNLIDLRDMNGEPVLRYITDIGRRSQRDASGWVFYLWEEGTQFLPRWKSAYIRKVVAPDGLVYMVGSGSYNLKIEKSFVRERVDLAVELIRSKGKSAAFDELKNPGSQFHFLDNYVFVMGMDGRALVDPAYPTLAGRDLSNFRDYIGRYVVKEMIRKLEKSDEAWVQYLWPRPGSSLPSRKLAYVRKTKVGNETLIVGSDFFLATPVWMRL
ncbi:MAG TPA: cache domain-containing protein [Geobacteraceae bacterium]